MPERTKVVYRNYRWFARLALIACLVAMVFWWTPAGSAKIQPPTLSIWEVQAPRPVWKELVAYFSHLAGQSLRFLPLGFLIPLSLPRAKGRWQRLFLNFLPALIVVPALVVSVRGGDIADGWIMPGPLDLVFPLLGALVGTWIGMTLLRGPMALVWMLPKAAFAVLLVGVLALAGLRFAIEPQPLEIETEEVTSERKRELVRRLKKSNPTKLAPDEVAHLNLSERDLDFLLAWGGSALGGIPRATIQTGADEAFLRASLPVPTGYLNLSLGTQARVREGSLRLDITRLSIGRLQTPSWMLKPGSRLVQAFIQNDRVLEPVMTNVTELRLSPEGLQVIYGKMDLRGEGLSRLLAELGAEEEVILAARAQLRHMDQSAGALLPGDNRFGACLEAAFGLARERSQSGDPVVENRGAILALATVLGHSSFRRFAGLDSEKDLIRRVQRKLGKVALRERSDWTKHFLLSAGITALSSTIVSDAAGLLKEELDADVEEGGSGFSFGDLLADRAGTRFAWVATRDRRHASAMQDRLDRGFHLDDFFPVADGLPENIPADVLEARYGGVGGERYLVIAERLERRLQTCAAYRVDPAR